MVDESLIPKLPPSPDWSSIDVPPKDSGKPITGPAYGPIAPAAGQPAGALSGKLVFMNCGHGWTYLSGWTLLRPVLLEMNEDYGNVDQLNMFATYCFNAGAVVIPCRPLGYQNNEVVVDNDDAAVSLRRYLDRQRRHQLFLRHSRRRGVSLRESRGHGDGDSDLHTDHPGGGLLPGVLLGVARGQSRGPVVSDRAYRRRIPSAHSALPGRQRLGLSGGILLQRGLQCGGGCGHYQQPAEHRDRQRGYRGRDPLREWHGRYQPRGRRFGLSAGGGELPVLGAGGPGRGDANLYLRFGIGRSA